MVIGNKMDLEERRVISIDQGQDLAATLGFPYFETSPVTKKGIIMYFSSKA